MSGWVDELGQVKLEPKHVKLAVKLMETIAKEDSDVNEDFFIEFNKTIDNALYNLNLLKEELNKEK